VNRKWTSLNISPSSLESWTNGWIWKMELSEMIEERLSFLQRFDGKSEGIIIFKKKLFGGR
jgi:hypothetical protein